jgi:ceramide glucosyltransferase
MLTAVLSAILVGLLITFLNLKRVIRSHKLVPQYKGVFPSVTVIRPVKGLDVGAAENFRAALSTGYPGEVETIFVFDGTDDPAYEVAAQVAKECGGRVQLIVSGPPPVGRTGKLHAMIAGEKAATGELIAFSDSDTRPDQKVLRVLVETLLTTPGAGSVFVPVICDQPMKKVGDVFYAFLQNALYAPWALLAAGSSRTLPFIMGQYMVFTRACLAKIGGVQCATGQLVDDMYIGSVVYKAGFLNVIAPYSLSIFSSGLSLREFIPLYRKWFLFGRNGLPLSFVWRQWLFGACFYAGLIGLLIALSTDHFVAAALALAILVVFCVGLAHIHRTFGGAAVPFRYWWAPSAMMLIALAILISNRLLRNVTWRGRVYKVDSRAALDVDTQPQGSSTQV